MCYIKGMEKGEVTICDCCSGRGYEIRDVRGKYILSKCRSCNGCGLSIPPCYMCYRPFVCMRTIPATYVYLECVNSNGKKFFPNRYFPQEDINKTPTDHQDKVDAFLKLFDGSIVSMDIDTNRRCTVFCDKFSNYENYGTRNDEAQLMSYWNNPEPIQNLQSLPSGFRCSLNKVRFFRKRRKVTSIGEHKRNLRKERKKVPKKERKED
jgi:hypothetical protein